MSMVTRERVGHAMARSCRHSAKQKNAGLCTRAPAVATDVAPGHPVEHMRVHHKSRLVHVYRSRSLPFVDEMRTLASRASVGCQPTTVARRLSSVTDQSDACSADARDRDDASGMGDSAVDASASFALH